MSRFTEHFDICIDQTIVHSPILQSPSKDSFSSTSTYSSRDLMDVNHTMNHYSIASSSNHGNDGNLLSSTPSLEEKQSNNKLKRFFTTISRKKGSIA